MGYGDFKLLAALGAWMGWQMLPLIIVLSTFVGAVVGIVGVLSKAKRPPGSHRLWAVSRYGRLDCPNLG